MFCSKCGQEIPEGTKICGNCGTDNSVGKQFSDEASDALHTAGENISSAFDDVKATISNNGVPVMGERLDSERSFWTYFFLSLITCGIYGIYYTYKLMLDVNVACDGDGETFDTSLGMFYLLTYVTCGIYMLVMMYKTVARLNNNAPRYGLSFKEDGTTYLLWTLLGAFLCCVGPYYAIYFTIQNSNALCGAYNAQNGL